MSALDPLLLARIQFALNISFHIIFPTITIGLGWILLYFRSRYTLSGDWLWEQAYYFWVKVFALTFALGVVSGITMSFQFGTNWPGFIARTGNISGPLLGYEVLSAFFLEATFLGIMLFGKNRVSNRLHLIATLLVAVGTTLSAFWILSLNSWMQTPQGYTIVDGKFYADDWIKIIFNPSFPYRFAHMLMASMLSSLFLVAGVSAWQLMKQLGSPYAATVLKATVLFAALLAPLQMLIGDLHGLNTLKHQPAKIAAIEAVWQTEKGAAFTLVGIPDEDSRSTHLAIKIPKLASWILTHDLNGEVQGLNEFEGVHPPVLPLFWAFRIMVGIGVLMLACSWLAGWYLLRNRQLPARLLQTLSVMRFAGLLATLAGWYVTEIGRQPWIVYGLLKTEEVVADHASATLLGTLFGYGLLYTFLLVSYFSALQYMASQSTAKPSAGGGGH